MLIKANGKPLVHIPAAIGPLETQFPFGNIVSWGRRPFTPLQSLGQQSGFVPMGFFGISDQVICIG
jgi:hypothetical protein